MSGLLLLALAAGPAFAAKADPVQKEAAAIIGQFYDLQLEKSLAAAKALERRHPTHPAGPFFKGIDLYLRLLVEESVSTSTMRAFESEMDRCIDLAAKDGSLQPAAAEFYQGGAYGYRARVALMQGRWFDAVGSARRAVDHVKKSAELDPSFDDVYLGLGTYHYFMSDLPAAARPFASLLVGIRGDREKGLAELERATRSPVAGSEAAAVLAYIYGSRREGMPDKADALLARLIKRHPHNAAYRVWRANWLGRRGRWKPALAALDVDGGWMAGASASVLRAGRPHVLYAAAELQLMAGNYKAAQARLKALDALGIKDGLREWIFLRKGNLQDALGRRKTALAYYRNTEGDAAEFARAYLEMPFPRGTEKLMPMHWPRFALPK